MRETDSAAACRRVAEELRSPSREESEEISAVVTAVNQRAVNHRAVTRRESGRLRTFFLLILMCAPSTVHSADTKGAPETPTRAKTGFAGDVESDTATMVVLTPSGPVFAELRLSVAKVPYTTWLSRLLTSQLDTNGDGMLTAEELTGITERVRRTANLPDAERILKEVAATISDSVDNRAATTAVHQAAEKISEVPAKAFTAWLRLRLPKTFELLAQPQSSDDAVRLVSLIDTDRDGAVSEDELLAAVHTLRFRDLDNDETFSISELVPYRDPRSLSAAITPSVAELPFLHVTDDASAELAADVILRRFGHDGKVLAGLLRQPPQELPSALDTTALQTLLRHPQHHLIVDVRLSDRANTSDVRVSVAEQAAAFCTIAESVFGQVSIRVDGLPIRIVARGGGANNRAFTRGFLGQSFVMVDGDRNQYLDMSEFEGIAGALQQSGVSAAFADVDINRDGMITRDELFSYVDRDLVATSSRIEVSVRQDGKTLFSLLDTNQDRRLSRREILNGVSVLSQYDINGDGRFSETELGTEYILNFGLGRSELIRSNTGRMMMSGPDMSRSDAILPGVAGLSGPEWFRRMDRNQDGDVSLREFPGTPEQFAEIDSDGDGLISAEEASAVQ